MNIPKDPAQRVAALERLSRIERPTDADNLEFCQVMGIEPTFSKGGDVLVNLPALAVVLGLTIDQMMERLQGVEGVEWHLPDEMVKPS